MKFKQLTIDEWKQFQHLDLEFHPRLTILTGANSSGKTTILNILAKQFGWNFQEISTPEKHKETGRFVYFPRAYQDHNIKDANIGNIIYENNYITPLTAPLQSEQAVYQVGFHNPQNVSGINIPSLRYTFHYDKSSKLSTEKITKSNAHLSVTQLSKDRTLRQRNISPGKKIKETLLNWAVYSYGSQVVESDQELIEFYEGFILILKQILPKSIGFQNLTIRKMEIVFVTDSGEFLLDAVSGGIAVLIDLVWQIFTLQTKENTPFTVIIDEVENHLYPAMQRSILSDLIKAFPNVQFIVSTHSPLVVGSAKDSHIYALRYNEHNRVFSEKLDLSGQSRSATDILREVLGVPFTMPIWVEEELSQIVEKYAALPITPDIFKNLRKELNEIGLSNLAPQAIAEVAGRLE